MADLLIEIGCEDLPAASIVPLSEHLGRELHGVLVEAGLAEAASGAAPSRSADSDATPADRPSIPRGERVPYTTFATPRRIGARWPDVGGRQPDRDIERKGPAVSAAYDADGAPTKALAGFLRSADASVEDLSTVETPKGAWVVLNLRQPGRTLAEIVSEALPGIVATMPMPRRMRWGAGEAEFLRPLVWLLAVHGGETLAVELFGLQAGNTTRGHRFHAPAPIRLDDPADYERLLRKAKVVAGFAERRQRVEESVRAEVRRIEEERIGTATLRESTCKPLQVQSDAALLDEVTALVEWPVALAGRFDTEFLELPDEALIQTMEENQRYFAVLDANGRLTDTFVTVANIESTKPATVIDGNERVIRPRFADTMFFWEQDRKRALADFRPELDRVLFQERLGSIGDKVRRLETLVARIEPLLGAEGSSEEVVLAASLCKCDLVSALVEELPKMQGIAGHRYAELDGHHPAVSGAIETHYKPAYAGDSLPHDAVGETLALADRLDTLVGIHGQGLVPSGTKDPFGLRRASIGIVRILIEGSDGRVAAGAGHDVDLADLVAVSARTYADRLDGIDERAIVDYLVERLRGYLIEQGRSPDAVDAVLAKDLSNPFDIVARVDAIERFRKSDAAVALAAASKRVGNILRKSGEASFGTVDPEALVEPAERALHETLERVGPDIGAHLREHEYVAAMRATATLREPLDAFFENVMVMDEDMRLRANRLALLGRLDALCGATAELSRLAPAEKPANASRAPGEAS